MRSQALVLTYHRIADGRDPLGQCVRPATFEEHLRVLQGTAEIVPLLDVSSARASRAVALTFDDGYACNSRTAAPILRAAGVPATFFVPSRVLDDPSEYWWDRLEHAHFDDGPRPATLDLEVAGRRVRIDIREADGRIRSIKALSRRLRVLPLPEIERVVGEVAAALGADAAPSCDAHALLDPNELRELSADPLFEVGSHAATHTMLSALAPADQESELAVSRAELGATIGTPPTTVAYPFGTSDATDAATPAMAAACGYSAGFLNTPGRIDARRSRFSQPRHMVHDWSAADFSREIEQWFRAL